MFFQGLMCAFTGSRNQSDANPGRCTKTGGYLAYAEITEIIKRGESTKVFHEDESDPDVMLYKGSPISHFSFLSQLRFLTLHCY
jgi:hypothetical protein